MKERIIALITEEKLNILENLKVLVVGIGGVGGYALETLVRGGISNITIIDGDVIEESNLNRQIITNGNNIGKDKVEEAKLRALSINPKVNIEAIKVVLTKDNFKEYINKDYDYIIDACDDIDIKIELIKYAKENMIKIICSMGTAKRLCPSSLEITSLNKTFNDPLAKKMRYLLRKEGIDLNIKVVFSKEEAKDIRELGSMMMVPAVAGIYLASYVINDAIEEKES